ncbi:MAG TPA: helix-turn-helix transcriptional regulator [Caulobacteraceae bacterium]|nr:helix-turn-helix transcriptional regulator [Caulobacteraceae bacterium]
MTRAVAPQTPHRLRAWRKQRRLTLEQLADQIGMSHQNLGRIERGEVPLSSDRIADIARALEVEPADLFRDPTGPAAQPGLVPLVGYVGAGAEAHFYASTDVLDYVPAPEGSTERTRAAQIRGESLGPLLDQWLLYYDDVRTPVTPDLVGKLCIVGLPDDRVLVKKLQPSRSAGLYHLISNTEAPILDQEVLWAALVRQMSPR